MGKGAETMVAKGLLTVVGAKLTLTVLDLWVVLLIKISFIWSG